MTNEAPGTVIILLDSKNKLKNYSVETLTIQLLKFLFRAWSLTF